MAVLALFVKSFLSRCGTLSLKTRIRNWNALEKVIFSDKLMEFISLHDGNKIEIHDISWHDYWQINFPSTPKNIQVNLDILYDARQGYLSDVANLDAKKKYSRAYFLLLDSVLNSSALSIDIRRLLLRKIVSFETVRVFQEPSTICLLLTNNISNPVYLLSRIRYPSVLDDPKYLPLVAATLEGSQCSSLFYHYRQFAPGTGNNLRLLTYLPVEKEKRFEAFHIYHCLQGAFSTKNDARCRERAAVITEAAIRPILKHIAKTQDISSIVDIGGGTGELSKNIFTRIFQDEANQQKQIAWEIVDVDFKNFHRHLKNKKIGRRFHTIRCERRNMFDWLEKERKFSVNHKPFHIILLCRIINNLSDYGILGTTCWHEAMRLTGQKTSKTDWLNGRHHPINALDTTGNVNDLNVTNSTLRGKNGTTFRQLSLSSYFEAVHEVCGMNLPFPREKTTIFYPLRSVSELSLQTFDGKSLIDRLCSLGEFVIIEDVDLSARCLKNHLNKHELFHLTATDLTRTERLTTSYLLCVAEKSKADILPGIKIW